MIKRMNVASAITSGRRQIITRHNLSCFIYLLFRRMGIFVWCQYTSTFIRVNVICVTLHDVTAHIALSREQAICKEIHTTRKPKCRIAHAQTARSKIRHNHGNSAAIATKKPTQALADIYGEHSGTTARAAA